MKRKRWFIASLTVVVLVLGIGGGTILAQESTSSDGTGRQSIFSRVASILGIEEQQVEDAFQQAAQEIQDERVQQKLAMLVERGVLTQEQADEYKPGSTPSPRGFRRGLGSKDATVTGPSVEVADGTARGSTSIGTGPLTLTGPPRPAPLPTRYRGPDVIERPLERSKKPWLGVRAKPGLLCALSATRSESPR